MNEESIIHIEEFGYDDTYDLEVDHSSHTFFANDISVSNSHSISYSVLSFQCAYLWYYYPSEWMASFLDKEPEKRKEKAINIAKSMGFTIKDLDINYSGKVWEIDKNDDNILIQPLTSIKGLGEKAIDQVINNRPFNNIEEFMFNENVVYSKLNKKAIDALVKSQALNSLMDDRFDGLKHYWCCLVGEKRPRTEKELEENLTLCKPLTDFTKEEKLEFLIELTGVFPIDLVMSKKVQDRLNEFKVPPISEFDSELGVVWGIPREIIVKKTQKGKFYFIVSMIDGNSVMTKVKCWGVDIEKDRIFVNRPYMLRVDFDPTWGFSTRGRVNKCWKLLG